MRLKSHTPIPAQQAKGKPPCDLRRQRIEAEQQRRADFARQNTAIAQRLKGVY